MFDADKEGKGLAEKHSVTGFPTYLLLDPKGQVLDRWSGYAGPAPFIETLKDALQKPIPIDERVQRFEKRPTAKDAARLARIRVSEAKIQDGIVLYRRAQELDAKADYTYDIFESSLNGYFHDKKCSVQEVRLAAEGVVAKDRAAPSQWIELARMTSEVARREKDPQLAVPFLAAAVEKTARLEDPALVEPRRELLVDHALYVEKNPSKALELKKSARKEGWEKSPAALNEFAWWCFENNVNLEEAETLARKGVELAAAGSERAMILDTVAEICNLRGSCRDAVRLIEQAIKEDPENPYYPKQLERFQKRVAEQG